MSTEVEKVQKNKSAKVPERDLVAELVDQVRLLTEELASVKAVKVKKESKRGQPRENVFYVILNVPTKNFPPQAIACMRILSEATDPTHVAEADAMRLLEEKKDRLGTRQESWRIFCYYRARLIEGDYLRMQ